MNTNQTYEASSLLGRGDARYDLPTPLLDGDGSAGNYPTDEDETGP